MHPLCAQHHQAILKGIFPAVALGAAASAGWMWWMRRPLAVLHSAAVDPDVQSNLKAVYRFKSPDQVSMRRTKLADSTHGLYDYALTGRMCGPHPLAQPVDHCRLMMWPAWPPFLIALKVATLMRVMRKWDEDGVPIPEGVEFGLFIAQVGEAAARAL